MNMTIETDDFYSEFDKDQKLVYMGSENSQEFIKLHTLLTKMGRNISASLRDTITFHYPLPSLVENIIRIIFIENMLTHNFNGFATKNFKRTLNFQALVRRLIMDPLGIPLITEIDQKSGMTPIDSYIAINTLAKHYGKKKYSFLEVWMVYFGFKNTNYRTPIYCEHNYEWGVGVFEIPEQRLNLIYITFIDKAIGSLLVINYKICKKNEIERAIEILIYQTINIQRDHHTEYTWKLPRKLVFINELAPSQKLKDIFFYTDIHLASSKASEFNHDLDDLWADFFTIPFLDLESPLENIYLVIDNFLKPHQTLMPKNIHESIEKKQGESLRYSNMIDHAYPHFSKLLPSQSLILTNDEFVELENSKLYIHDKRNLSPYINKPVEIRYGKNYAGEKYGFIYTKVPKSEVPKVTLQQPVPAFDYLDLYDGRNIRSDDPDSDQWLYEFDREIPLMHSDESSIREITRPLDHEVRIAKLFPEKIEHYPKNI